MTAYQNYPGQPPQGYPQGYPQPPKKNGGMLAAVISLGVLGVAAIIAAILFGTGVIGSDDAEPSTTPSTTSEAPADPTSDEPSPESSETPSGDPADPTETDEPGEEETDDGPRVADPDDLPEGTVYQENIPVSDLTFVSSENYHVAELSDGETPIGYRIVSANTEPADVDHVLTVFFDYSCPHCVDFEQFFSDELTSYVSDGTIALELRPLSFLPPAYSSLGVAALSAVAENDPEHLLAFHTALMAHSAEGGMSENPTDVILAAAESVGVTSEAIEAFTTSSDTAWAESLTEYTPENFKGTPTVLIDGVEIVIPSSSFADLLG